AETKLEDAGRAAVLLGRILDAEPLHEQAFRRLRHVFERRQDWKSLVGLLGRRLGVEPDAGEVTRLRFERAACLAGRLGDRDSAKEELRTILGSDPQNGEALSELADLEVEDGAYAVAAELYIRQARFERDTERLREIFLRIGRLYQVRLPDTKLA